MGWVDSISSWLTGGPQGYMTLFHCMNRDTFWVAATVTLDLLVALGYVLIAVHWRRNQRLLPASPARSALGNMKNIFLFCGICGYIFIPVKMFWPAWRLYDMFMCVLVFYTWQYALSAKNLKVIYSALGRSNQLAEDLAKSREESKRKSFFLNAISHDLRTPLNGLLLHANLAELSAKDGDAAGAAQSIEEIKSCARHTAELLDGLLEYARLEASEDRVAVADFELDQLLRDVLNTHAAMAARKGLALSGNTNSGVVLHTDRLKLERILNNLLSNAIKFTSSGSVRIDVEWANDCGEIHVIDTGVGIAPEHQERLFEEFFQVSNHERDRQKGFGLGLAISRRLARQLGGDLEVHSSPGNGSRFTICLPVLDPSVARTAAATPNAGGQPVLVGPAAAVTGAGATALGGATVGDAATRALGGR
jgi:signal transduction histidine kinase